PARFDLRGHVRDLEPQMLEISEGMPELLPLFEVLHRVLECRLRQTDRPSRRVRTSDFETGHRLVEPTSFLTEERISGQNEVVERQLPGLPSVIPDLLRRRPGDPLGEGAAFLLDEEHRDPPMPLLLHRGASKQDDVVCLIGIRAPHLRAIDDPITISIAFCLAPQIRHIRPSLSLGKSESTEVLTTGNLRQQTGLLLRREPTTHAVAAS